MKLILLVAVAIMSPVLTFAHQPLLPDFVTYDDTLIVEDISISQAYYGNLNGFPHTYKFTIEKPQQLFVEVLVPDIEGIKKDKSAIIVRKLNTGRVEEISKLKASEATWESFFEPFGGDSYKRGASYDDMIEPGSYLVEVSTPDNIGKYVLVFGEIENFKGVGVFELLGRIHEVKKFFEKPSIAVLQSPFYYVPTMLLIIIVIFTYRRYKIKHA